VLYMKSNIIYPLEYAKFEQNQHLSNTNGTHFQLTMCHNKVSLWSRGINENTEPYYTVLYE
jgi:hypothetical protein